MMILKMHPQLESDLRHFTGYNFENFLKEQVKKINLCEEEEISVVSDISVEKNEIKTVGDKRLKVSFLLQDGKLSVETREEV